MDVIVSMVSSNRRMVYHRPGCMYVKKMRPQNRMMLSQQQARNLKYHSCKYCGGLRGEMRVNSQFPKWEKKYKISIDYVEKSNTLYVRTEIGCWKIFHKEELDQFLLYHRNTYKKEMTFGQAIHGEYHRQRDVKPTLSIPNLIDYIVNHDKARLIIMDDYRKLPKSTARQRKYYRKAENKAKRLERRQTRMRIEELFKKIEAEDPSICRLAFC